MIDKFKHFPNFKFCKVHPNSKKPIGRNWQKNYYSFDEAKKHFENGGNYGILTGHENLIIIDADLVTRENRIKVPEYDGILEEHIEKYLPSTLTVKSGSGAKHYYYFCEGINKREVFKSKIKDITLHWGEILSIGNQVIGPGCIHPETGKKYEIIKDFPIATISKIELFKTLRDYLPTFNSKEVISSGISAIDELNVLDIFGSAGLKLHNGEYSGAHPTHGSSTGTNFWINPNKNTWHCFRCDSGGGPASAIAVKHGVIDCCDTSRLHGDKFKEVIKIAKEEYNLIEKPFEKESMNNKENSVKVELKRELKPFSFSDFMNKEDKKIYYVNRMFASSTINMIFAPPKNMKSFISYYLGLCISQGKPFFNQKTKKVNVCYFDWENPIGDVQNRIKGICEGMDFNMKEIDNFYFFPRQHTLVRVEKFATIVYADLREQLISFIKENDIKVLFFDTLRRLGNFEENDSTTINTIKSDLFDPIINETGACIIFLHHTSKEGATYRGSVDIEGIIDTSFKITKKEKGDYIEVNLNCAARRNNEIDKISSFVTIENESFEDEEGDMFEKITEVTFERTIDKDDQDENYSEYRKIMIDNLNLEKDYKNKELIELLRNNSDITSINTLNKIIKWLTSKNILLKSGSNKNTRYSLNPELKPLIENVYSENQESQTVTPQLIEAKLNSMFQEYDVIKKNKIINDPKFNLNGLFSLEYIAPILDSWNKKAWLKITDKEIRVTKKYREDNK